MNVSTMMAFSRKGSPKRLQIIIHDPEAARGQSTTKPEALGAELKKKSTTIF